MTLGANLIASRSNQIGVDLVEVSQEVGRQTIPHRRIVFYRWLVSTLENLQKISRTVYLPGSVKGVVRQCQDHAGFEHDH